MNVPTTTPVAKMPLIERNRNTSQKVVYESHSSPPFYPIHGFGFPSAMSMMVMIDAGSKNPIANPMILPTTANLIIVQNASSQTRMNAIALDVLRLIPRAHPHPRVPALRLSEFDSVQVEDAVFGAPWVPVGASVLFPLPDVHEVPCDRCCRRHLGAYEMRPPAASLPSFEVAVGSRGAAFAG